MRVVVLIADPPIARWHAAVADAIRGERDVTIVGARDDNVDVVVDLMHQANLPEARHGVWRYGFGDGSVVAAGATGTLARLYRLTSAPGSVQVLREGWLRAASGDAPGIRDVAGAVSSWAALALRELAARGELDGSVEPLAVCEAPLPWSPRASAMTSIQGAIRRWQRRERWTIGIVPWAIEYVLKREEIPQPHWVTGTADDRYLADPFPLSVKNDRVTLLAEEYRYREGRGRIVRMEVDREGGLIDRYPILESDHHVAYPFVIRDGDDVFCIPDFEAAGSTCAYPLEPPHTPVTLLPGVPAVDPTLVRHDGRWWLFCARSGPMNQTDLYVFHADVWRGPWQPHALNPVKSDARSGRPAGAFFRSGGALYRPAQDCSRRYGGAIAVNRVIDLTPARFREETVCTLRPSASWAWPDGLHTLNAIDDLLIVDALRVER